MIPTGFLCCLIADLDAGQRNFRFVSMFGFTMILMASWESIIRFVNLMAWMTVENWDLFWICSVSNIGLVNGGTAGLIWMFFICWVAFIFINTSMYVPITSKNQQYFSMYILLIQNSQGGNGIDDAYSWRPVCDTAYNLPTRNS